MKKAKTQTKSNANANATVKTKVGRQEATIDKETFVVQKEDLRLLLLSTFRYSLGRETYMPSFIVTQLMEYEKALHVSDWQQLSTEIEDYLVDSKGSADNSSWKKLLRFANKYAHTNTNTYDDN